MALVLAIEPDLRQAGILTRIVREKVKADVVIVDTRDAAMEAMRTAVPDVMLLSALLSPRDEDELVAHLRTLEGAEHLQTHTIPQLASWGGDGASGPARGLLKAFRRKKDTAPAVSGCDPDLFAQEIRVFLEQAEQKRHERAEELKYRPAGAPVKTVVATEARPAPEEPEIPAPTTSWDSPFEWRKSDKPPAPLASFEQEPAPPSTKFQPVEEPAAEPEFSWSAHLLEPSSLRGGSRSVPEPPASSAGESAVGPDHLLEAHPESIAEAQPFEMPFDTSREPHPLEAHADVTPELPAVIQTYDEASHEREEIEASSEIAPEPQAAAAHMLEVVAPDAEAIEAQPAAITPYAEAIEARSAAITPPAEAIEAQSAEIAPQDGAIQAQEGGITPEAAIEPMEIAPGLEATEAQREAEIFADERLDAPELFETFVPSPVEELQSAPVADALPPFENVARFEEILQTAAPAESAIATPEEIEAYGRFAEPAGPVPSTPEPSVAGTEAFSIEYVVDPGPAHDEPVAPIPAAIGVPPTRDAASDEEEIDLSWAVDDLRSDAASAEVLNTTAAIEAPEFESGGPAFDQSEPETVAADAELPGEPRAGRPPVNLGPLATWARLERKADEERRPGSDMREIIERLAVPPHIAGVSYARGVRIRRLRVAGTRDRRRPADQSGPVILSRRALAETRSVAP